MRQLIKRFSWVGLLALSLQGAWAFSLGGPIGNGGTVPGDGWQQPVIGYGVGGDLNAPKNLGEEYRRNTPVMYYACNANFLGYFGSNGVVAIDQAFTILNALTNVNSYSPGLSEFPLESRHLNYQAQALGLYDLKSWTLAAMMEQVGLADPVRYDWTLHDRAHVGNIACPVGMEYLVVQRNFDVINSPLNQLQYSPYVNDTLYSYYIIEFCTGPNPLALAVPFSVDPLADTYSPVASFDIGYGTFYTGLTRDDVAGLRYLLSTNNINYEDTAAGSLLISSTSGGTNFGAPFPLYTSDLGALLASAQTNDPATLVGLFPGLTILSTVTNPFVIVQTPIIVSYLAPVIGAPAGTMKLVIATNGFTTTITTNYADTFANVIITTNSFRTNSSATLLTVSVAPKIGAPAGTLATNTTVQIITLTNVPSGDYYISTNPCGPNLILAPQPPGFPLTNVVATTNLILVASNSAGFFYSQSLVTYATNHVFGAVPIVCASGGTAGQANVSGLYQGIDQMQFVRADYDSLLGQFFQPVTNTYTMVFITNSQAIKQTFQRVVTTPDFIFSAADLAAGPSSTPNPVVYSFDRNLNFDQAHALPGLAGPGLITSSTTITFDKVSPVFYNEFNTSLMDGTPYFTETPGNDGSDFYYFFYFVWSSYDGTTNDPVVYPDGTSIQNLENEILVQIAPTSLANGTNGVNYYPPGVTFTASGGAFTYSPAPTWTATGLPPGLTLSPGGTLSGTPTQSGAFAFTLTMTDALGRSVQWNYSVTIQ